MVFCFIICNILFLRGAFSLEKEWIWSNQWNMPDNWKPTRLPCVQDHIEIADGVVFIGNNVTVTNGLTLPRNGEIIFGDQTEFVFQRPTSSPVEPNCIAGGINMTFVGQPTKQWFNPLNWHFVTDGIKDDYLTRSAPYIERLPCKSDKVIFPRGNAFSTNITDQVTVKEMVLNGQSTSNAALQAYIKSDEGIYRFQMSGEIASLDIDSLFSCPPKGCRCSNYQLKKEICNTFTCPKTCIKKVLPHRDCCHRCGALVNFLPSRNFVLQSCWKTLRSVIKANTSFNIVSIYMSRINDEKIQVLVTDSHNGMSSEKAVPVIKDYLQSTQSASDCHGTDINIVFGKETDGESDTHGGGLSEAVISSAIILPIVVFAIVVVLVALYMRRHKRNSGFHPKKFTNDDIMFPVSDIELASANDLVDPALGSTSFTNPTYTIMDNENQKNEDDKSPAYGIPAYSMADTVTMNDLEKHPDVFSNPLYAANANSKPSEEELEDNSDTDSIRSLKANLKLELKMEEGEKEKEEGKEEKNGSDNEDKGGEKGDRGEHSNC